MSPELGLGVKIEAGGKATSLLFVERGLVLKHISELYIYGQTQKNNELLITFCGNAFFGVFFNRQVVDLGKSQNVKLT